MTEQSDSVVREPPTSSTDFEFALARAEVLLREVDRSRDQARRLRSLQAAIPLFVALAAAIAIGASGESFVRAVVMIVVCAVIATLAMGMMQVNMVAPAVRRISRDERAMLEIIGILRELLGAVADNEQWSASRERLARTRIARFPIGPRGVK